MFRMIKTKRKELPCTFVFLLTIDLTWPSPIFLFLPPFSLSENFGGWVGVVRVIVQICNLSPNETFDMIYKATAVMAKLN